MKGGEEVLARWTDCRYYPAKIESINKEGKCHFHVSRDTLSNKSARACLKMSVFTGTYTVQFYDGVIRCVKRIHIKSMPEDAKGQVRDFLRCLYDNGFTERFIYFITPFIDSLK